MHFLWSCQWGNSLLLWMQVVAEARLGISEPTLHRIETGKVPVTVANVRALCWLYGADGSITDALAELALGTSQQEWWDEWASRWAGGAPLGD